MGRHRSRSPEEKKRKKKSRRHSPSPEDNGKISKVSYEQELQRIKAERKRQKEQYKALETAEEKRQRRLAKKEAKALKNNRERGADQFGYTDSNNPYGDSHITEAFVWEKKFEKEGVKGLLESQKRQKEKKEEMRIELEKVKKRKMEREAEKQARQDEMALIQRDKEAALFSGWVNQEDEFHLHQARLRSSIRIRDGRAKPIDLLAAYINPMGDEEHLEIQMHEPYACLVGLSIDDLEDVIEDIKVYMTIDHEKNQQFWKDITIVVKDELEKLKKKKNEVSCSSMQRKAINSSVQTDVQNIFHGKTHAQLCALQTQMKEKVKKGGNIDVGYWETLLQQLEAVMAKSRLKERHQQFLKKKLTELKMETVVPLKEPVASSSSKETDKDFKAPLPVEEEEETPTDNGYEKAELQRLTAEELKQKSIALYDQCDYEPTLINFTEIEEDKWIDPKGDISKLMYLRQQVKAGSTVQEEEEADNLFNTEVLRGMNENEEAFNAPVAIKTPSRYLWSDKYKPRKPRFFNRVHTGYEWNKYNQTHYDQDNPPPKVVQGYKFNIFYPDLIDKTITPEYTLVQCDDDEDFCILRFKAGPPYEDIAFKVVDREWECSNRHGFKCQFYNNIFQLYFHFKKYRYRR